MTRSRSIKYYIQTNHKFKIRPVEGGFHPAIAAARKMQIRIFPIRCRWCSIIKVWFSRPSNSLWPLRYPHGHTGTPNRFHSTTRNRLTSVQWQAAKRFFPGIVKRSKPNGLTTSEQSDAALKSFISFLSYCTWYPCHTPRILHYGGLAQLHM